MGETSGERLIRYVADNNFSPTSPPVEVDYAHPYEIT